MTDTARLSPQNSLLLVLDPATGVLPEALGGASIAATSSGLAIGTLAEFDGETEVVLAILGEAPDDGSLTVRWEGPIETSGRIGVLTIYNDVVLETDAPSVAQVRVWTNHPDEPDVVWIAIS